MKQFSRFVVTAIGAIAAVSMGGCGGGSSSSGDEDVCTSLRIAGGTECTERPLSVAVLATDFGYCTGTFITPRKLLTAAHCIPPSGREMLVATRGYSIKTTRAVTHPRYSSLGFSPYDIAIVTISKDAPVQPAPLELSTDVQAGDGVVVYGYGLDENGNDIVQRVQEGGVSLKATTLNVASVSPSSVQTLSDGSGDTCGGDSGGPIVRKGGDGRYGIVAIVRSGPDTCEPDVGLPSENTNIQAAQIRDFVLKQAPGVEIN